jgi:hypothetical protein
MEEDLYSKLSEVIRKDYPDSIVTHFTAVVTVVDAEGTELVITLDRPEQPLWQSMGMLDFVREMRRAIIANQVCEPNEDD